MIRSITNEEWKVKQEQLMEWRKNIKKSLSIKEANEFRENYFDYKNITGRIMDIGCGDMGLKEYFKTLPYIGIDPEFSDPSRHIIRAEWETYKSDDINTDGVDYILAFSVLQHCRDPFIFLAKCRDALVKNAGKIYITIYADKKNDLLTQPASANEWTRFILKYFDIYELLLDNQILYMKGRPHNEMD